MKTYEEMLENALENFPNITLSSDRYTLPEVEIRFEKNRTYILNIKEILYKIKRSPEEFRGDFLRILGVPGRIEKDILVLNGLINREILKRKLEEYVKLFVICEVCRKPETIIMNENNIRYLRCIACGNKKILRY